MGSQLQLGVEVIVLTLNGVVCPGGLTKDTPADDWVTTTGNPTCFPHTEQLSGDDPVQCPLIC